MALYNKESENISETISENSENFPIAALTSWYTERARKIDERVGQVTLSS